MSEEMCPTCGKNPCGCSGKQNIKVSVSLSEEMKKAIEENALLKERLKLKEAEGIAANEALATAEGILAENERKRKEYAEKHPPAGKASFTAPGNAEEYKDRVSMIDSLYDQAYYHKENYTAEQVKDAKKKIETLITSMVDGPSWKELGKGTKPILQHELGTCQNCGFTLVDTSKCPNCSYDPSVKTRVQKTRLGGKEEAYKAPKVT